MEFGVKENSMKRDEVIDKWDLFINVMCAIC